MNRAFIEYLLTELNIRGNAISYVTRIQDKQMFVFIDEGKINQNLLLTNNLILQYHTLLPAAYAFA